MNILVFSDSHGEVDLMEKICLDERPDKIFHLGDNSQDAKDLSKRLKKDIIFVKGNCDYYDNNTSLERLIEIKNKKIFLSHGHMYSVKNGYNNLFYRGKELGADLVIFGHTHIPYLQEWENMVLLNPGSLSLPKIGYRPSYGKISVENGSMKIVHKFIK